jgi:long-chain fatty acid transport protein
MKIGRFSHIRERIMSLVKYAGVSLIAMSASMGHAGGMEATALSAGFMFEDGSYGSASVQSQSPSVQGTIAAAGLAALSPGGTVGASATTGSLIGSVTSTNLKAKMDVLDNMSVGIAYYRQAGIKLDYQNNWATALTAPALPKVDLDVTSLVVLVKYDVNENFSALGGLKNGTASDATVSIPIKTALSATATGKSALSYIAGAAYEIPEIALRVELMYETSAAYSLPTAFAVSPVIPGLSAGLGTAQTGTIDASTPDYINLYVQSGIAEDTLAYASARQANWKTNQVSYTHPLGNSQTLGGALDNSELGTAYTLSDFADTTSYEIGLGRKFGTTWSSSIAYNWEGGSGPSSTSLFTLTDGRQGISVGAKYNFSENTAISFGGNYTQFGDVTHVAAPLGGTVFSGNTATTLGLNFSTSF